MHSKKINYLCITILLMILFGGLYTVNTVKKEAINAKINNNKLIINTAEELCDFSDSVNNGNDYRGIYVVLNSDIDMSEIGYYFNPIGTYGSNNYFFGIFDGHGHTIKNMVIDIEEGEANNGLFGTLGGTVCNLVIENGIIKGNECGAICATSFSDESAIYNCVVNNTVIEANTTDGISGVFDGRRENLIFDNKFVIVDDWGMLEEKIYSLNLGLMKLSDTVYNLPMNCWTVVDDRLTLSQETENTVEFGLKLNNNKINDDLKSFYVSSDDAYYIVLPYEVSNTEGKITANDAYGNIKSYDVNITQNEEGISELELDFNGKFCHIKVLHMENTPSIFISTGVQYSEDILIRNKENELNGTVQVFDEDGIENYNHGLEAISGRGYHSWQFARKKGYGLKLLKKGNLLGLGNAENYVLLPGQRDASILSYVMTMELDKRLDWPYASDYRLVNYYLDGEYQGLYILCEKIETGKNRVNIKDRVDYTGAYLYEMRYDCLEGKEIITTDIGNVYVIRTPKYPKETEREYSISLWNNIEKSIYSNDEIDENGKSFSDYIDLPTWARLFMIFELNGEYSIHGSLYFYKESDLKGDGKVYALQPWDVEHSYIKMDHINESIFRDMSPNDHNGLLRMLCEKPEMKEMEQKCWQEEIRPVIVDMMSDSGNGKSFLWNTVDKYELASKANEAKWGEEHNFADKAASIEQWLNERIQVLDQEGFY